VIASVARLRAALKFANLVLVACAASVVALALLRPDLDISQDPISEYVHGPFAYVQVAVFFAVGASSIVIAAGLWRAGGSERGRGRGGGGVTAALTLAWAVAIIIAGLIDVEDQILNTEKGAVHDLVAKTAFIVLFGAAVTAVRHTPRHSPRRIVAGGMAAAMGAALAFTAATDGGRWFGLTERVLAGTAIAWLVLVGSQLAMG
jgi:hypothetical protein